MSAHGWTSTRRRQPREGKVRHLGPYDGEYEYELRRAGAVIATGRLHLDEPPAPGDMLSLGRRRVRVADVVGRRLILEQR